MIRRLLFRSEVHDDLVSAAAWYDSKSVGLGSEFLRIFYAATATLLRFPLSSRKVYGAFRRRLLRRFPYAIYYLADRQSVTVFGVFHCARSPITIRAGLRSRR